LLILILLALLVLSRREQITQPFVPTLIPTPGAFVFGQQAIELYQAGNLRDAIDYYREAVRLEPNDAAYRIPLARLLILTGDPPGALEQAEKAVELAPNSARALAALCQAQDWNGQLPQAIDNCRRAIELDPTYAEAHAYLAEAYTDSILSGDYSVGWQEAIQEAERAIELDPQSVDAFRNLGYIWNSQGFYEVSNEYYYKALEINPRLSYLYVGVALNYRALVAYHASRYEWAAAEASYQAAIETLEQAIEVDPQSAAAYDELGWLYYNNDQDAQAQAKLEQAVEVDPDFALAWSHLGFVRYRRRNYEGAEDAFKKAIELGYERADTFYTLGWVLYYRAQCEEAIPYFNQALALEPDNPDALSGIQYCLEAEDENTTPTP
jgi:tetratricopeptide (TPR) repeat protein